MTGHSTTGTQSAGLEHLRLIAVEQADAVAKQALRAAPAVSFERNPRALPVYTPRPGSDLRDRRDRSGPRRGPGDPALLPAEDDTLGRLTAGYSRIRTGILLALTTAGLAFLLQQHAAEMATGDSLAGLWIGLSVLLILTQLLAWTDRARTVTPIQAERLDRLRVTVNVPVYNEDPEALVLVARALAKQTRPPQRVDFVDDGSDKFSYRDVRSELGALSLSYPATEFRWIRTERGPESGKRSAQAVTFRADPHADVFVTIDSDTILDPSAIEEGLKPFADRRVMSVAAILLVYNAGRNLLTGLTDIWLAVYQTGIRAAWSRLGCVLVNSGGLSFYRAEVIRDALPAYLGETFAGRRVSYSDDAMLTFYAMLKGRTVQQPTSFAFTIMPEKVGHHVRQQLRWMRGNVIRTLWRFRYLSPLRLGWWLNFIAWATFIVTTLLMTWLFIGDPIADRYLPAVPVTSVVGLTYLVSLRALLIRRADQSTVRRLVTFAAAPLITIWSMTVLRVLRLWALLTCMESGWGTRQKVEVTVSGDAS